MMPHVMMRWNAAHHDAIHHDLHVMMLHVTMLQIMMLQEKKIYAATDAASPPSLDWPTIHIVVLTFFFGNNDVTECS